MITGTCKSSVCYSSVDATGKVFRGCTDCSSDPSTCNKCNNALNCNSDIYQSCYQCNATDPNCISSPSNINHCPPNNICFTKLTPDGFVERGCAAKDYHCDATNCSTCSGDNCNKEVFPASRLSCLQCNGTDDCNAGLTIGKYCSKYVENDECFTYADGNNSMIRGCFSDDTQRNCTTSNCEKCNSTNCNTLKFNERPSTLKCYQCDLNCHVIDENELKASTCKNYPFNANEKCYTLADNNTLTVERGCYYDVADIEKRCENGPHCSTCSDCIDCITTMMH